MPQHLDRVRVCDPRANLLPKQSGARTCAGLSSACSVIWAGSNSNGREQQQQHDLARFA